MPFAPPGPDVPLPAATAHSIFACDPCSPAAVRNTLDHHLACKVIVIRAASHFRVVTRDRPALFPAQVPHPPR